MTTPTAPLQTVQIPSPDGQSVTTAPVTQLPPAAPPPPRRLRASTMPFTDISVCIGQTDANSQRKETVHQINGTDSDIRITSVEHKVLEKTRASKEDGQLVGFEPTGEYELTLKVKWIKD